MGRTGALLLGFALMAASSAAQGALPIAPGFGQPPRDSQTKTGTARIRGRVIAADTGTPLRKAIVRAFSTELREGRTVTTDAQGAYELKDLPAGRYSVTASKGSYLALSYGQTRPNQQGRPLEILDAQALEKIDFALPRGSVITGRVLDEFGEPVADVMVMPMRQTMQRGQRRLNPIGRQAQSNDIGEFRIFGIAPGSYYLSATIRSDYGVNIDNDDRSGYAPTYYPGTPNSAEAQRVTVGVGQTVSDVIITLVVARTARITGTVVDAQGQAVTRGGVNLEQRTSNGFMGGFGAPIKPDGTFAISSVPPGDYTLRANVQGDGSTPQFATARVTVNGEDIAGVQLSVVKTVTATGRFVVADPAAAQTLKPAMLNLFLAPADIEERFAMFGGPPRVKDDFTFEARVAPGRYRVNLGGTSNFFVKAVRQGGVEVTDSGIDIEPGRDISDLEIELTNHPASVSGMVTNSRSETVADYSVIVFAQDRDKWSPPTRYSSVGRPDQDGRFKIRTLPPGDYFAIAVDAYNSEDFGDPDFFDRLKDRATRFSLTDGETKILDLRLQNGG